MLEDSQVGSVQARMMQWALMHPDEWDVVLGFAEADADKVMLIQKQLKAAGFTELPELLAMRAYRLLSDNGSSGS